MGAALPRRGLPHWARWGLAGLALAIAAPIALDAAISWDVNTRAHRLAREAVADISRDPASLQFRDMFLRPGSSGGYVVCGQVNGRNAYGGMTGYRWFFYQPTRAGEAAYVRIEGVNNIGHISEVCDLVTRGVR